MLTATMTPCGAVFPLSPPDGERVGVRGSKTTLDARFMETSDEEVIR